MALAHLHDTAKAELFNEVLPFWLKNGVDNEWGGFICGLGHSGNTLDSSKYVWYQGRGAWVFAKLYARTKQEEHLNIARKALAFVEKHCKKDDTTFYTIVAKDGAVDKERSQIDHVGYASLFYAEGLQQVAVHEAIETRQAMLETTYQTCRTFLSKCTKDRNAPEHSYLLSTPYTQGTRTLGHQMIPLRLATQVLTNHGEILTQKHSVYFNQVAKDMVHNITVHFYDNEVDLTREELSYTFTPLNDPVLYYLGHAIEAYWFVMAEGCRIKDNTLIELACDRIRRHVECAWDPVFGGLNRGLSLCNNGKSSGHHNLSGADYNDKQLMDKVAWVEQEGLVALLMVQERSGRPEMREWASTWHTKLHEWVMQRFPLKSKFGYDLWLVGGDRRATFEEKYTFGNAGLKSRKENYHHPRYLMAVMEEHERTTALRQEEEEEEEEGAAGRQKSRGGMFMFVFVALVLSLLYDLIFKSAPVVMEDESNGQEL
jgi:N-acylglucosamine 2-epimerase